jgi:hypothetical protein
VFTSAGLLQVRIEGLGQSEELNNGEGVQEEVGSSDFSKGEEVVLGVPEFLRALVSGEDAEGVDSERCIIGAGEGRLGHLTDVVFFKDNIVERTADNDHAQ